MNEIEEQRKYMQKVKELNNKKMKYTILTMGCQLNENDSENEEKKEFRCNICWEPKSLWGILLL